MKTLSLLLTALIGLSLAAPELSARESSKRGDGGKGNRDAKRSPMTGSKVQKPKARPQPKPASRPQSKPTTKPTTKPQAKPQAKPATRPQAKPEARPQPKPSTRPAQRPSAEKPTVQRPSTKPATRPGAQVPDRRPEAGRPDKRPSIDRPDKNRPGTLPGMVTYPNRPDHGKPGRPGVNNRPSTLPGMGQRPGTGNRPALNRPSSRPVNNRNWNSNKWGGNRSVWGNNNNVNIKINNNFKNNYNYSYRPDYWGGRPWWGAGNHHNWHHGHWNYGWNSPHYNSHWYFHDDDDFASGFMWGIAVWSIGNMIYDMGYKTYTNPYPAPPVQNTYVNYSQPVSVAAAGNPPGDEQQVRIAETQSAEAVARSRSAFKQGDYVTAMGAVDEALGHTPGDVTLHEYRALVFFALGKYANAAGVLNPVLASGPGWGWDTMIEFYNSSETYDGQLRKLEAYVKGGPEAADGHFLLGYHYMVCGHTEKSYEQFAKASELQPADSISRQLRDLTKSSLPVENGDNVEPPARPDPVPPEKLIGTWISDRGADGKVTFTMAGDGNYTWNFMNGGQSSELKGTYALNEKGLLVLSSEDSQMISEVVLKDDTQLHFTLVGAPDGDPGLEFVKN